MTRTSDLEEALAWQLTIARVEAWVREYPFHPTRKWRFDFAWPDLKLAVEVEGGIWTGGGHTRGAGFSRDVEKSNEAALLGWRVLRVVPHMIRDGKALALIERALSG